jgi:hypothetical protein
MQRRTRKSKKHDHRKIFTKTGKQSKILGLPQETPQAGQPCGNFLAAGSA